MPQFQWKKTDYAKISHTTQESESYNKGYCAKALKGRVLVHGQIDRQTPGFFADDGVHLSTIGYHMNWFSLSKALSAFMRQVDLKVFNLDS